ncbi:hypothetical protein TcYC6_0126780 [Trypanosoma cruzi]|nr:hypothetical protein TcYC6_0126780 [Trypanosoma cruzi]
MTRRFYPSLNKRWVFTEPPGIRRGLQEEGRDYVAVVTQAYAPNFTDTTAHDAYERSRRFIARLKQKDAGRGIRETEAVASLLASVDF